MEVNTIAVIGAGTMGRGIAYAKVDFVILSPSDEDGRRISTCSLP